MPKKIFILDTNVLLHEPGAIFSFEDNDLIIPIVVIEELDKFKKGEDEKGRNARQVSRDLDRLRKDGKLSAGVQLPGGGMLKVELNHTKPPEKLPDGLDWEIKVDNRIICVALNLQKEGGLPVILVTKDSNLRIKADALGITAQDYESDKVADIDELYSGVKEIEAQPEAMSAFFELGSVPAPEGLMPNQFVIMSLPGSKPVFSRHDHATKSLVAVTDMGKHKAWDIKARNREQQFALELLLNDEIRLVTLIGRAGTGKTMLALAAGLQKTVEDHGFQRLVVSRPIMPLGKDLGFMPGDIDEKMKPWMQPIRDNLDFLMGSQQATAQSKQKKNLQNLTELGMIEVEPLMHIRGRSMPDQYFIVDEAQNLTPHEIKTIVTRAGEGTKIVLTGDPYQIDHPYLDSSSNGLSFVVERFKNEPIAGHVTLTKCERSDLAELAATLL